MSNYRMISLSHDFTNFKIRIHGEGVTCDGSTSNILSKISTTFPDPALQRFKDNNIAFATETSTFVVCGGNKVWLNITYKDSVEAFKLKFIINLHMKKITIYLQLFTDNPGIKSNVCWRIQLGIAGDKTWRGPSNMALARNYPCMVAVGDKVIYSFVQLLGL